ncbi:MAG: hypothetical protein HY903_03200 [Deltaproteobacteria bacterium]|nr:hypothetical protein [Deltaproteobacteria bacterium]
MKHPLLVFSTLCGLACATEEPAAPTGDPWHLGPGLGLVLTSSQTYETGSLDLFQAAAPNDSRHDTVLAAGDAALRLLTHGALILDRGIPGNVTLLDDALAVVAQVALPDCGPHDAVPLPDGRLLISCYETALMAILDPASERLSAGPDLSRFADADGNPEMDRMLLANDRIYVTLQLLDRRTYASSGLAQIAVLDASTLTLVDARPNAIGLQGLELPLANPYTGITLLGDGRLAVGCAGDWSYPASIGVAAVDPASGAASILYGGRALGGPPISMSAAPDGRLHALISFPDGMLPTEMRLVRLDSGAATTLYRASGFNLAGLAFDAAGNVFIGNRSPDSSAGLWRIDAATGSTAGPFATGLLPVEIEIAR